MEAVLGYSRSYVWFPQSFWRVYGTDSENRTGLTRNSGWITQHQEVGTFSCKSGQTFLSCSTLKTREWLVVSSVRNPMLPHTRRNRKSMSRWSGKLTKKQDNSSPLSKAHSAR